MSEKNKRETAGHETAGDEIISGNEAGGFGDEMEFSVPSNAMATVRRLWKAMGRQRIRLIIVAGFVGFYTKPVSFKHLTLPAAFRGVGSVVCRLV